MNIMSKILVHDTFIRSFLKQFKLVRLAIKTSLIGKTIRWSNITFFDQYILYQSWQKAFQSTEIVGDLIYERARDAFLLLSTLGGTLPDFPAEM